MPRGPAAAIGDEPVPIGEPDEDGEFDDGDDEDEDDEEDDEPMQARGCARTAVVPGLRPQV
jgi:hypothetical protein